MDTILTITSHSKQSESTMIRLWKHFIARCPLIAD